MKFRVYFLRRILYLALHVFKEANFVERSSATTDVHVGAESIAIGGIDRSFFVDFLRFTDVLSWYVGPLLSEADHCSCVH